MLSGAHKLFMLNVLMMIVVASIENLWKNDLSIAVIESNCQ
jgi:hypothetical protein